MAEDRRQKREDQRKDRYKVVGTGVFGLVLALSAFSITTTDFRSTDEVWQALSVFVPAFFFVLAIWEVTGELFDRYPSGDYVFYMFVTAVLFLTTLAPAFLNLLLAEERSVQRLSAILFPISMAGVFAVLGLLWVRLGRIQRKQGETPEPDIRDGVLAAVSVVAIFLLSLLVPFGADGGAPRTYVWFAAFILPRAMLWLLRRVRD